MNISSTSDLVTELKRRAKIAELDVQCASDGTFNAQIAIVAEAPGSREVEMGLPLVGGAGTILWNALAKYGVRRKECYITNVSKRQIALTQSSRRPMNKYEQQQWIELVRWELAQLPNLRYILVLGNLALEAVTGHTGITQWRGSVLDTYVPFGRAPAEKSKAVKAICTYNPAMVAREPKVELPFTFDCAKLKRVIEGNYHPYIIKAHINPTKAEALEWIEKMRREGEPVSFDIEVISNETACVGLGNEPHEGMCIAWRDRGSNLYSVEEERQIRMALQQMFADNSVQLVAQNATFDSYWLWYKDKIRVGAVWFDTMLAHHLLYPTLPHNLGFLTTQYTDHPFYKDEKKDWKEGGDINSFWNYNVKDTCLTHKIHSMLMAELRAQGLDKFFFEHVMRLQPHLVRMTVGGVLVDTDLREKLDAEMQEAVSEKLQAFQDAVHEATGDHDLYVNPNSPKQLSHLLFSKMKLVGRGSSTDKVNRDRMKQHPRTTDKQRRVLEAIDEFSQEHKFYSTYVTTQLDPDNRIRCEYKQTGVQSAPGRLSSSKVLWGSGMNLQNQPKRALPMYIADEGYTFGYFDMSQAEARVVAWKARIDAWIEQFERARVDGSYDAHRALAAEMFGVPYDEVPTNDHDAVGKHTIRYTAKRCRHGLNYRMGADRLATVLGVPLAEAYRLWHIYHRTTPELQQWWHQTEKEARDKKALYNAYGRRWLLLERLSPEALESIVAFYPQSTVGDHVSRVIFQSESDDRWPHDARMALNVHDALICLAPIDKVMTCLSIMKKYAEAPIIIDGEPLVIPAETKVAIPDEQSFRRWSTLKAVEVEAAK